MTTQRYERVPEWSLGDRLRKARNTTGMTVKQFAAHIGISPKSVNNAEGDKHAVRKIVLNAWSLGTGISVDWLETGQTDPTSYDPGPGEGGDAASTLVRSYGISRLAAVA